MAKKRTKSAKIRTSKRNARVTSNESGGYKASFDEFDIKNVNKKIRKTVEANDKFFRSDLTKVLVLTMLALASEIVLWLLLRH